MSRKLLCAVGAAVALIVPLAGTAVAGQALAADGPCVYRTGPLGVTYVVPCDSPGAEPAVPFSV